jgi:hypothetical protein
MSLGRPLVVMVALCSLAAPATAPAQQQAAAQPATDAGAVHGRNETLSRVIIYGSIGAIAGALGSLRVRRAPDAVGDDEAAGR